MKLPDTTGGRQKLILDLTALFVALLEGESGVKGGGKNSGRKRKRE